MSIFPSVNTVRCLVLAERWESNKILSIWNFHGNTGSSFIFSFQGLAKGRPNQFNRIFNPSLMANSNKRSLKLIWHNLFCTRTKEMMSGGLSGELGSRQMSTGEDLEKVFMVRPPVRTLHWRICEDSAWSRNPNHTNESWKVYNFISWATISAKHRRRAAAASDICLKPSEQWTII